MVTEDEEVSELLLLLSEVLVELRKVKEEKVVIARVALPLEVLSEELDEDVTDDVVREVLEEEEVLVSQVVALHPQVS